MEYLNQFHKESTERCLKQIEEWKKSPPSSEQACKQAFEMHKRLNEQYPEEMQEKTELHLRYNWGKPNETRMTVEVDQERLDKIQALVDNGVTLEEAYDQTEEE